MGTYGSSRAFDLANWTTVPTQAQMQALWDASYRRAIVGCSYGTDKSGSGLPFGELTRRQLAAVVAFGFELQAYAFVEWANPIPALAAAYKAITGFPVTRMWLDIEEAATGRSTTELVATIWRCIDNGRQWRPDLPMGIYTGGWWWRAYMPQVYETFGLPLWVADYRQVSHITEVLCGGWHETELDMWQWSADGFAGLNTDLNMVFVRDDMTTDEVNALIRQYVDPKTTALYLNALQNGADIMRHGAQIDAIAGAFFAHVQAGGAVDPALAQQVADIQKAQADLEARVKAAATVLNPPS